MSKTCELLLRNNHEGLIGPLRPAPSHSIYSFHDGLDLCFAPELAPLDLPLPILFTRSTMDWICASHGNWPPHTGPWPILFTPPAWKIYPLTRGGLAPAHRPLAYPNYAASMENISAYAGGFPPAAHFLVRKTAIRGLDYLLTCPRSLVT